jgi:hypothetical protein
MSGCRFAAKKHSHSYLNTGSASVRESRNFPDKSRQRRSMQRLGQRVPIPDRAQHHLRAECSTRAGSVGGVRTHCCQFWRTTPSACRTSVQ